MPSAASALKLFDLVQSHRVTAVIYVAAKLGIAELLRNGPKSVDELAKATGADQHALGRLLVALSTVGICSRAGGDRFELTEMGSGLDSAAETSFKGWAIFEGELGHAAHVARVAGSFKPVDHDDFSTGFAGGALGMHQNLDVWFGRVELGFDGEAFFVQAAFGEVPSQREQVRVADQGAERFQAFQFTRFRFRTENEGILLTRISKEHLPSYFHAKLLSVSEICVVVSDRFGAVTCCARHAGGGLDRGA